MARYGFGDIAFFLVGGYDLKGDITEITTDFEELLEETTVAGETAQTWATVGVRRGALSQNGFFNDTTGGLHDRLTANQGQEKVVCVAVAGNTAGRHVICFAGDLQTKYNRRPARGELHKASAEYIATGARADPLAVLLATLTARTDVTDSDTSSVDGLAASTGGRAYLQVTSITLGGYTNVAIKLRDSADNVSFADVTGGAFTAVTAIGAQALSIAGTIRRYVLVRQNFTGAGTGQTITYAVCLARN